MKNHKNFVLASIASSVGIVYYFVFTTLIDQIIEPFGITSSSFFGSLGIIFNSCGMVGGIITATILGKYPTLFKHAGLTIATLTLVTLSVFVYAVYLVDMEFI